MLNRTAEHNVMTNLSRSLTGFILIGSLCLSLPFLTGSGCAGGTNGDNSQTAGSGTLVVDAPSVDIAVSAGDPVTIVYDATNGPVSAFYDLDGVAGTGDEVTFASNLATGTNKFTQLQTT